MRNRIQQCVDAAEKKRFEARRNYLSADLKDLNLRAKQIADRHKASLPVYSLTSTQRVLSQLAHNAPCASPLPPKPQLSIVLPNINIKGVMIAKPVSEFCKKVEDRIKQLAFAVGEGASCGSADCIGEQLSLLRALSAENPLEHDLFIQAHATYSDLYRSFPAWQENKKLQQMYEAQDAGIFGAFAMRSVSKDNQGNYKNNGFFNSELGGLLLSAGEQYPDLVFGKGRASGASPDNYRHQHQEALSAAKNERFSRGY